MASINWRITPAQLRALVWTGLLLCALIAGALTTNYVGMFTTAVGARTFTPAIHNSSPFRPSACGGITAGCYPVAR